MMLENNYYKVHRIQRDETSISMHVSFIRECTVFQGHFPGHPVCPGACNIQLIKEATMKLTGKNLFISAIRQCRFTALATPDACPEVDVQVNTEHTEEGYIVTGCISDERQAYVEFKGNMTIV